MKSTVLILLLLLAAAAAIGFLARRAGRASDNGTNSQQTPAEARGNGATSRATLPDNHVQLGVRAFMKGRYERAFRLLEPAGHEGNLKAQQLLAKMYYAGHGVTASKDQYLYWLGKAAANGDKPSKIKLKKMKSGQTRFPGE